MRVPCLFIVVASCAEPGGGGSAPMAPSPDDAGASDVWHPSSETYTELPAVEDSAAPAPTDDAADRACACLIDGACFAEGAREPDNLCRACRAALDANAWSPDDGPKCSDGDPCTSGERCVLGTCGGGAAVVSPSCAPAEPTCETHFDCYPTRVCGHWRQDGVDRCSEPCNARDECPAGFECAKLPGSAQVGFCEPAVGDALVDGSPCSHDEDCQSGACHMGVCRALCFDEGACATGTCQLADDATARARGLATSACVPDADAAPLGATCSPDGGQSYGGSACASGHCDLMPYPASLALPCAPLCRRESDCGAGQECSVVMYGEVPHPGAIGFHPQLSAPTHDAVSACFTSPNGAGWLGEGAPCSAPEECRSDKCLHLLPGTAQRHCTAFCASDVDCPNGMACKLDSLTLASPWFQTSTINAQPPRPDARTLVRVCKFL